MLDPEEMMRRRPDGSSIIGLRYGVPGPATLNAAEKRCLGGMFEDGESFRASFADRRQQVTGDCGARALFREILADAAHILRAFHRAHPEQGPVFYETLEWVDGECRSAPHCSFEQVCAVLGFEPEQLRRRLREIARGPRRNGKLVHGMEMRAGTRTRVGVWEINCREANRAMRRTRRRA